MAVYWRKRELDHISKMIKDDAIIAKRIRLNQMRALEEIQLQTDAFFGRYADSEGISMSEARRRANMVDIDKFSKKAKRYVKERNFTKRANEEMRVYNLKMKVSRLELLKLNIELELISMISDEEKVLFEALTGNAKAEYIRQSGILGQTIAFNEKSIATIANSSFLSATWSDRLWDNQDALSSELNRLLNRGIVQGTNPKVLSRDFRKKFDSSVYNSERLLITESARVQQDVFQESMKQVGIEQYIFIAEPTACPICAELDDKVFYLKDAEIGVNAYPIHPRCRCSQAMYMDRGAFEKELEARGL